MAYTPHCGAERYRVAGTVPSQEAPCPRTESAPDIHHRTSTGTPLKHAPGRARQGRVSAAAAGWPTRASASTDRLAPEIAHRPLTEDPVPLLLRSRLAGNLLGVGTGQARGDGLLCLLGVGIVVGDDQAGHGPEGSGPELVAAPVVAQGGGDVGVADGGGDLLGLAERLEALSPVRGHRPTPES